jgi:phosphatidylglycerol:prolipoprotein diacylglycerol transferase
MHPVLMRWGTQNLYSYSVALCVAVLLGTAYVLWRTRGVLPRDAMQATWADWSLLDGALWTLAAGFIGARLAYVGGNWQDYAGRPAALWQDWGGALVFQGGLLAGLLALWLYSFWSRRSFGRLVDAAAPAVALAQSIGWVGALLHGANYGVVMRSPFSLWLPDLYGVYGPRLPTQLLAALLGMGLFLGLHRLGRFRLVPGTIGLIYLFGNGLGHLMLEFTRADDAVFLCALRLTQWAELAQVVVASALMLRIWRRARTGQTRRRHRSALEGRQQA